MSLAEEVAALTSKGAFDDDPPGEAWSKPLVTKLPEVEVGDPMQELFNRGSGLGQRAVDMNEVWNAVWEVKHLVDGRPVPPEVVGTGRDREYLEGQKKWMEILEKNAHEEKARRLLTEGLLKLRDTRGRPVSPTPGGVQKSMLEMVKCEEELDKAKEGYEVVAGKRREEVEDFEKKVKDKIEEKKSTLKEIRTLFTKLSTIQDELTDLNSDLDHSIEEAMSLDDRSAIFFSAVSDTLSSSPRSAQSQSDHNDTCMQYFTDMMDFLSTQKEAAREAADIDLTNHMQRVKENNLKKPDQQPKVPSFFTPLPSEVRK